MIDYRTTFVSSTAINGYYY